MKALNFRILHLALLCIIMIIALPGAQVSLKKDILKKLNSIQVDSQITKSAGEAKKSVEKKAAEAVDSDGQISLVNDLSDDDEYALGRQIAGRILAVSPPAANDSLQRYVNLVGRFVAQQCRRPNLNWTFAVMESVDINAFSTPGGYVLITSGLYATLDNEAELAAILGHEIAHVDRRDHVRLMQKDRLIAKGQKTLTGLTKQDVLKELAGSGAQIAARTFDKKAEFECDLMGIEYAAKAGYDPFAYIDAIDRMGANTQTDRLSLLFKTHPTPRDRINALEKNIGTKWNNIGGAAPQRLVVSGQ